MLDQEKEMIRPDIADYFYPAGTLAYLIMQRQCWEHRGGERGEGVTARVYASQGKKGNFLEVYSVDKRWMAHADTFQRAVHRFGGLGWLLSWCPWTPQWRARSKFARFVAELRVQTLKDSKILGEKEMVPHRFDPSQRRWNRLKYAVVFAVFAVAAVALLAAAGWLPVLSTMIAVPFLAHYWVATAAAAYLALVFASAKLYCLMRGYSFSVPSIRFKNASLFTANDVGQEKAVQSNMRIVMNILNPVVWLVLANLYLSSIVYTCWKACLSEKAAYKCAAIPFLIFGLLLLPLLLPTNFVLGCLMLGAMTLYKAWIAPCIETPEAIATPENNSLGSVALQLQEGECGIAQAISRSAAQKRSYAYIGVGGEQEVDLDDTANLPRDVIGKPCYYILFKPSDDVVTIDEKGAALESGFFTSLIGGPTASAVA